MTKLDQLQPIDAHWAIEEGAARRFLDALKAVSPADAHARHVAARQAQAEEGDSRPYRMDRGVAVLSLEGPMTKRPTSMSWMFGGTSTIEMRQALRAAERDPEVASVLLVVDSPGGQVAGTSDLAADVARVAKVKPVIAYVSDLAASAAYWVASGATEVWANDTAIVGSIGTYMVVEDSKALADEMGVTVYVVRAGEHKGAGVPGTAVTQAHLAEWQRPVDALNDEFVGAVARGRGLDDEGARRLADGRVHVGAAAKALGLIDGVASLDAVLGDMATGILPARKIAAAAAGGRGMASLKDKLLAVLHGHGGDDESGNQAATEHIALVAGTLQPDAVTQKALEEATAKAHELQSQLKATQDAQLGACADAWAKGLVASGKRLPEAVPAASDLYKQLARDDAAETGGLLQFAADGSLVKGTRVQGLEAVVAAQPASGLIGEQLQEHVKAGKPVVALGQREGGAAESVATAKAAAREYAEQANGKGRKAGGKK